MPLQIYIAKKWDNKMQIAVGIGTNPICSLHKQGAANRQLSRFSGFTAQFGD
jgi:hypothetical protein